MEFEVRRQIVHILLGTVAVLLIYHDLFILPVFTGLLVVGILLSIGSRNHDLPVVSSLLDSFEREQERYRFPGRGALFLLAGVLLAVALFEKHVALAAVLVVTVGDSITHIVGRYLGSRSNPLNEKKDMEGFIAGTLACFLVTLLVLPLSAAMVVAVSAMLFESLDHRLDNKLIDDNLTVPLVVGATYYGFTALTQFVLNLF